MPNLPQNLTRNILQQMAPNQRGIRALEQALTQINDVLPTELQAVKTDAGTALASSSAALDAVQQIAQALELLASISPAEHDNSLTADYLDLRDGGWSPAHRTGRLWFGPTGTLEVAMGNGNITQQVGEEFFRYGKASSAISDTHLQLVYKTGVVGASGVITFAPSVAGITDADQILGIATEPISLNAFGRITTAGVVHGINTTGSAYGETWADNDDIWYNPTTGGLTKTKPSAPNLKVQIGTVINAASGGAGSFSVKIGSSSSLGGTDSNVQLSATPANNSFIVYNSATSRWEDYSSANSRTALGLGTMATKNIGASGSFQSADTPPKTITVVDGIITSIV